MSEHQSAEELAKAVNAGELEESQFMTDYQRGYLDGISENGPGDYEDRLEYALRKTNAPPNDLHEPILLEASIHAHDWILALQHGGPGSWPKGSEAARHELNAAIAKAEPAEGKD